MTGKQKEQPEATSQEHHCVLLLCVKMGGPVLLASYGEVEPRNQWSVEEEFCLIKLIF